MIWKIIQKNYYKTFKNNEDINEKNTKTENNELIIIKDSQKFNKVYNRYSEYKNYMKFSFFENLKSKIFFNSKIENKYYNLVEKYSDLLTNKLDLFYYLKDIKKQELINKILFNRTQMETLDFISNKIYPFLTNFNFKQEIHQNNHNFREEIKNICIGYKKNPKFKIDKMISEIFYS